MSEPRDWDADERDAHPLCSDGLDLRAARVREALETGHRLLDRADRDAYVIERKRAGVHGVPWLSSGLPATRPGTP